MDKQSVQGVPASTAARPVEEATLANNEPKADNSRRAVGIFCDQVLSTTREMHDALEISNEKLRLLMREVQELQEKTGS
ncbi:hypothetical protein NEUTE1DRAFT_48868 [Neurospora tetrasperma FGSC 2508]|uniref:Uncharacterized protein n=1 Tax=Neurospora tetrasperma (strain FGSC 2508 / ATCC MYA-4615 / P0657) TaxID=510951 RepID=F8MX52_NEUT8|nr:uncharacterized protein NEUTE1DRAFT_48868 [Neurospora tetrasperma FGSC 2508]EGO54323.1 hypothetical protein NEUTE1DRAFT_48868 [Neurospora tetrasperma FGSC 2508]EGZ68241.1 hypothetical protein NEUTE2DRAFT_132897 [Neurospora tetrasperma FGSC 2509]